MSRDGSGTYSLPEAAFVFDTVISETAMNSNLSDIAAALTASLAADGQTTVTANLPMNSKKLTGLAVGSAAGDSANLGQVQAQAYIWCGVATGTADAAVLTPSPAITAYAAGQHFRWIASANANTGAMTVAVSGLATIAVQNDGAALAAGDHAASKVYEGVLDTASTIQITRVMIGVPLAGGALTGITSINGHGMWGNRNLLINGEHQVDQRVSDTRTGLGAAAAFLSDRWFIDSNGSASARWTASVAETETGGSKAKYLKLLCTTADATPGVSEGNVITQRIEGKNCRGIVASDGSIAAHVVSLRVIAHADGASSITFPAKLCVGVRTYDGTGRHYYTNVTIVADGVAETVSITVPADAVGEIANDEGHGLDVTIGLYAGANLLATDATWENSGGSIGFTAVSDNWADAANNYVAFTEAQLEPGSTATAFEHRPIAAEIEECQRYLPAFNSNSTNEPVCPGSAIDTTSGRFFFRLPVQPRVPPTGITISAAIHFKTRDNAGAVTDALSTLTFSLASESTVEMDGTCNAVIVAGESTPLMAISADAQILFTGCEL